MAWMRRVVVFGNSGAGKSTLAGDLKRREGLAHLDLDTLAWESTTPPTRRPLARSAEGIERFVRKHPAWVIEGCYADLLEVVADRCTEMIFLNPGVQVCIAHCRQRPWEPHKYATKAQQDENLAFLIEWVRAYETRTDEFSLRAHRRLFDAHAGPKRELTEPIARPDEV